MRPFISNGNPYIRVSDLKENREDKIQMFSVDIMLSWFCKALVEIEKYGFSKVKRKPNFIFSVMLQVMSMMEEYTTLLT